jgi:hypothetical protein
MFRLTSVLVTAVDSHKSFWLTAGFLRSRGKVSRSGCPNPGRSVLVILDYSWQMLSRMLFRPLADGQGAASSDGRRGLQTMALLAMHWVLAPAEQ